MQKISFFIIEEKKYRKCPALLVMCSSRVLESQSGSKGIVNNIYCFAYADSHRNNSIRAFHTRKCMFSLPKEFLHSYIQPAPEWIIAPFNKV